MRCHTQQSVEANTNCMFKLMVEKSMAATTPYPVPDSTQLGHPVAVRVVTDMNMQAIQHCLQQSWGNLNDSEPQENRIGATLV